MFKALTIKILKTPKLLAIAILSICELDNFPKVSLQNNKPSFHIDPKYSPLNDSALYECT